MSKGPIANAKGGHEDHRKKDRASRRERRAQKNIKKDAKCRAEEKGAEGKEIRSSKEKERGRGPIEEERKDEG